MIYEHEFADIWETKYGRLPDESRRNLLRDTRTESICQYPKALVEDAVRQFKHPDDILRWLRQHGSTEDNLRNHQSQPTSAKTPGSEGRGGKSHLSGSVWTAPLRQPNAKPSVDKPEPYN